MSAPPKKKRIVTCENKNRHPDELTARAAALHSIERHPPENGALWIYQCPVCRGWHLTKRNHGIGRKVIAGGPVVKAMRTT